MDKKVIVDFDETLISVNSFTKWVSFILVHSFKRADLKVFFNIVRLAFYRKVVKRYTHQTFKLKLIQLNLTEDYYTNFSKQLSRSINSKVVYLIEELCEEDYSIIISSAAPEEYLKHFIAYYFKRKEIVVIGSTIENNVLVDNFGEQKLNTLIDRNILEVGERFEALFTDSYHDLPLAEFAKKVYLINPTENSLNIFIGRFATKTKIIE